MSLANLIWGVITCTWFGVDVQYLPGFLKAISLPALSAANPDTATVQQNTMLFCFGLGLLHLCIAHILGMGRKIKEKSPSALGDLGNLLMLIGMFDVIRNLVVISKGFGGVAEDKWPLYLLCVGFVLNFVFGNYQTGVGQAILDSLKSIISVVLGVANVFGDIMSYIRLWAVGLAGASIAQTVDKMAGPLLGNFLIFLGILILFIGHGFNMMLNVLSVLVHGVRLNTLEFSQHLGLGWTGFGYKPLSNKR
jgi:V/A-type H+-transporting ATPase subunit I